jgi:hypothetical protein
MSKIFRVYLIDTYKEVGQEVNTKKIKNVLMPRKQNTGQNHNAKREHRAY